MPLRKGNPVAADAAAAAESTSHVEMDIHDDPTPEIHPRQEPEPPASLQRRAEPPAPAEVQTHAPAEVEMGDHPEEVEAEVEQAAPANALSASAASAPAVAAATEIAPASPAAQGHVQDRLAAAGFEGLNFGYGSFPIITLQNTGSFESSEGHEVADGFYCVLFASTPKWIFKNDAKGKDEDFCYSYDGVTATDGKPVTDKTSAWEANGQKWEKKPYLDVQAKLVTDDDNDGQMVLLSVPKTSIPRFSGYTATLMARGKLPNQVITQVSVGDKVTKVQYPFCPWTFKYYADCND